MSDEAEAPEESDDQARQITLVTRATSSTSSACCRPRGGRLDEVEFLGRLYDLEKMRSTDARFRNAAGIDAEYISWRVTRMEGAVDTDPELAIGTAKEFVESVCKTVLDDRAVTYEKSDDLPTLVRKTMKTLQLTRDDIAENAPVVGCDEPPQPATTTAAASTRASARTHIAQRS